MLFKCKCCGRITDVGVLQYCICRDCLELVDYCLDLLVDDDEIQQGGEYNEQQKNAENP